MMHRIAWIALIGLGSTLWFSACSDGGSGTSSSSAASGGGGAGGSSSGTAGSGGGVGGTGGSGSCVVDGQCAPSGPCKTVACIDGTCVEDLVADGTLVNAVIGDCKRQECNATGDVVDVVDNNDKPEDYNPCTIDACTGGVPSNTADTAKNGQSCGSGQSKCLDGKCQGCNSASNCPDGAICDRPVCDAQKVCGFVIDTGKIVSNTSPSDCFLEQCDSSGVVQTVSAPLEMPAQDDNECDIEVCGSNGVEHMPVTDGTVCNGSTECSPRACMAGQCTNSPFPGMETIVADQIGGDCKVNVCNGSGSVVETNDDQDAPADPDPNDCTLVKCSGGAVMNMLAPAGTACIPPGGVMGTCSATGVCS